MAFQVLTLLAASLASVIAAAPPGSRSAGASFAVGANVAPACRIDVVEPVAEGPSATIDCTIPVPHEIAYSDLVIGAAGQDAKVRSSTVTKVAMPYARTPAPIGYRFIAVSY